MSKVFVVTDSTSDMPNEVVSDLGIAVVPLNVHFGDEVFKDGVNMTAGDFFARLPEAETMPRTSQPSPGDFDQIYRDVAKQAGDGDFDIISIHISSDMSGTCQSAQMAREMVAEDGIKVTVVDSRLVSTALGMMVKTVAQAAREGQTLEQLVALAESIRDQTRIYFTVDTLEYLEKNGRIGKAQALLGGLLKVKPVLQIREGVVTQFEKLRGAKKVMPRLKALADENVPAGKQALFSVMYTGDSAAIAPLVEHVESAGIAADVMVGQIGPVVGCHGGPGALGLSVCVL